MKLHPISIRETFRLAWPVYQRHFALLTSILLTMFGSWVVLEVVVIAGQRFGIVLWTAAHLAFLIVFSGLELGLLHVCFILQEGGKPRFADAFSQMELGPRFLAGQVIYLLVVVAGLVLLIIPGVYLGVRYSLLGFCMLAGESNVKRCFQQSANLSAGVQTGLLRMFVFLFVFNVLGACLLGLGLFITAPLSALMMTAIFRQLSRH